jgi:hypothetical protein
MKGVRGVGRGDQAPEVAGLAWCELLGVDADAGNVCAYAVEVDAVVGGDLQTAGQVLAPSG